MTLTLRPYQEAGRDFLRSVWSGDGPRVRLLCDEMGLGKTPQAVMALPGEPWGELDPAVLIVCPAGLRTVWERHIADWRPDLRATVVKTTREIRAPFDGEAVIVSPDALGWAAPAKGKGTPARGSKVAAQSALARLRAGLLAAGPRLVVVLDEAHRLKGADARRAQVVGDLLRPCVAQGATAWALTATPMPRDPGDIWCLLHRLGADRHPSAFGGHGQAGWSRWCGARNVGRGRWAYAPRPICPLDDQGALGGILLRRLVADHLPEIPAPTHSIRLVSIDGALKSEADEILKSACKAIGVDWRRTDRTDTTADEVDEVLMREMSMRRGELATFSAAIAALKVPAVMEELQDLLRAGEPTLVYSEHRAAIDAVKAAGFPVIMGGMDNAAKTKAADAFQNGDAEALGFTGAGREGFTLTRASTMIEADANWSADDRSQAIGRFIRFGREGSASVIHVLADHPIERLKMRVLRRKRDFNLTALGSSL